MCSFTSSNNLPCPYSYLERIDDQPNDHDSPA